MPVCAVSCNFRKTYRARFDFQLTIYFCPCRFGWRPKCMFLGNPVNLPNRRRVQGSVSSVNFLHQLGLIFGRKIVSHLFLSGGPLIVCSFRVVRRFSNASVRGRSWANRMQPEEERGLCSLAPILGPRDPQSSVGLIIRAHFPSPVFY
jgi:hypothetical protein